MTHEDEHRLIDWMAVTGENVLQCTCGVEIHPACDMSSASIAKAYERHLEATS